MKRSINIVNPVPVIKALQDMECGKSYVAKINSKDFELRQFETKPLPTIELAPEFPFCCESHTELYQIGVDRFAKFPNCCDAHKKLNAANWFEKSNYKYFPLKLVTTITYTRHCIIECIQHENWYKEITDYIEETINSFGQFPHGYGSPLGLELYLVNIENNIKDGLGVPGDKQQKLLDFLSKLDKPSDSFEKTDLDLLISIYKEWLKIFPFDISYLKHLKPRFEKSIPILKGEVSTNIYSG